MKKSYFVLVFYCISNLFCIHSKPTYNNSMDIFSLIGLIFNTQFTTYTSTMADARVYHTATLLNTGKVLVVGGTSDNSTALSTAELYDPDPALFTSTGSMKDKRGDHTATLLPSGKVLIVGGTTDGSTGLSTVHLPEGKEKYPQCRATSRRRLRRV